VRRLFLIPVMVAAAACATTIPATGASAKPPPLAITAIAGNSTGSLGAVCEFGGSSPTRAMRNMATKWFGRSCTLTVRRYSVGAQPRRRSVQVPSPFTPFGLGVIQGSPPAMPAGSYIFDVQLLANGSVVSEHHTGPFPVSGLPAPSGCPAVGQLATYP
jgi:hypothetical protein